MTDFRCYLDGLETLRDVARTLAAQHPRCDEQWSPARTVHAACSGNGGVDLGAIATEAGIPEEEAEALLVREYERLVVR